jgi:hypothetical protein
MSDWIPVSEDLPETGVEVLVADQDGSLLLDICGTSGKFTVEFPIFAGVVITHWMPLPKPPQDK